MRYFAFTILLATLGCSAGENQSSGAQTETQSDEHFLQDQQDALKKAKEAAAALEAATRRTEELIRQTEQD